MNQTSTSNRSTSLPTLGKLESNNGFVRLHIGLGDSQIREMLQTLELDSLNKLIDKTLTSQIQSIKPLRLPAP